MQRLWTVARVTKHQIRTSGLYYLLMTFLCLQDFDYYCLLGLWASTGGGVVSIIRVIRLIGHDGICSAGHLTSRAFAEDEQILLSADPP